MSLSSPASEKKSVRGILSTAQTAQDEECVYRQKCRVFAMRDNKWIELGQGDAKLLLHSRTGRTRLTLRKEKTVTYILNHFVQPDAILVPARSEKEADGSRAFVFEADDFATSEKRKETFAIRFKVEAAAASFQKAYIEAQDRNREIPSSLVSTSSSITDSGAGASLSSIKAKKPAASEDEAVKTPPQPLSPSRKAAASPAVIKASLSPLPKTATGPGSLLSSSAVGSPPKSSPARAPATTTASLATPTAALTTSSSSRLVSPVAATVNVVVAAPDSTSKNFTSTSLSSLTSSSSSSSPSSSSSSSSSSSTLLSTPRVTDQAIQEEDEEEDGDEEEVEEETDAIDPPKIPDIENTIPQTSKGGGASSSSLLLATAAAIVITGAVALALNPKLLASAIKTRDSLIKQAVTFIESVSKKTGK